MYSIDITRHFPNQETWFLQATVLEDGTPIFSVRNDGTGGSHYYEPITDDYEAFHEALKRFDAVAEALPREFDFEKSDWLVEDLLTEWFLAHTNKPDLLAIGLTEKDFA